MVFGACGAQHQRLAQPLVGEELLPVFEHAQIRPRLKMENNVMGNWPGMTCLAMDFIVKVQLIVKSILNFKLCLAETYISFVVGGSAATKSKAEILEIPQSNIFPNLPYLPKSISASNIIGMADSGHIVVCAISVDSIMECYSLFMNDGSFGFWRKANFTMHAVRSYAATVKIQDNTNHSWLVAGGEKHDSKGGVVERLDTTEIFSDSIFTPGPILPQPVSMHCMFKLDKTRLVSTGGRGLTSRGLHNVDVLTLNFEWHTLANMAIARYGHVCGHYGKDQVIVAGGLNIEETEVFSIKFREW